RARRGPPPPRPGGEAGSPLPAGSTAVSPTDMSEVGRQLRGDARLRNGARPRRTARVAQPCPGRRGAHRALARTGSARRRAVLRGRPGSRGDPAGGGAVGPAPRPPKDPRVGGRG